VSLQAARILAKLSSWGKVRMALREQKYYLGWLIVSLNNVVGENFDLHMNYTLCVGR